MVNLFGGNYEEFGSSDANLILKTKGKIKIQWGNKFIDLLDNNGNIGGKGSDLIKKVSSSELMKEDGLYNIQSVEVTSSSSSGKRRASSVVASIGGELIDLTSQADWNLTDSSQTDYIRNKPTNLSLFINDVGFITLHLSLARYALKDELFSGNYNDLINKPVIPEQVLADWNQTDPTSPDYIKNKPSITNSGGTEISLEGYATELWVNQQGFLTTHQDLTNYALKSELFSGNYNDLSNKPTIPSLTGYATETWVGLLGYLTQHQDLSLYALKSELFSGSYNDLSDKPTIPDTSSFVDLTNAQNITGIKTFVGEKRILFKLSGANDKLGFTLYDTSSNEVGFLEYRTGGIGNYPILTLGNYHSASGINPTYVGFRNYDNVDKSLYNLVAPLAKDIKSDFNLTTTATNLYIPLKFTNGTDSVIANSHGIVNISSLLGNSGGGSLTLQQSDWNQTDNTSVDYIKNKPIIPSIWKGTLALYNSLLNIDSDTLYIIV